VSRRLLPTGLALLLASSTVCAQYLNRAAYLGRDSEGVRRNYTQGEAYFIDRYTYVVQPPWMDRDPDFRIPGTAWAGGSTSSTKLTIEGKLLADAQLDDRFGFRGLILQSENQDTQYQRVGLELDYKFSDTWSTFLQLEGTTDKSQDDLSLGIARTEPDSDLRFMVTFVDFASRKSDVSVYTKDAYAVMLNGRFGLVDAANLRFDVSAQLPMRIRFDDTGQRFALERYIGLVEGRLPIHEGHTLVASLETEFTSKELRTNDALDPLAEDLDRDFEIIRVESWHSFDDGIELSVGGFYVHKREDGRRINDPAASLRLRRTEWIGTVRAEIPLSPKVAFEPKLTAGTVDYEERGQRAPGSDRKFDGFKGRIDTPFLFRFSDTAFLQLGWGMQLDKFTTAGGSLVFRADF